MLKKIKEIAKRKRSILRADNLRQAVAIEVRNGYRDDNEVKTFFHDIAHYGCVDGMISSLIYFEDTHKFFDKFYDEIEEMREQWEENIGEPMVIKGDLKNCFAWFAFQETALQLANELGIEI